MRLWMIVFMLFGIGITLDRISSRLADIRTQLVMANCITEMKSGVQCPEMKK